MKKINLAILVLALMALDNELNAWWPPGVPSMPYPEGVPYSMPPVPTPAAPQYPGVPYSGMPYSIPQGVPYPYAGMPVPPPPPLPQYSGVPYMPAFAAPYANNVGQDVYNAAVPEYSKVTGEAESKVSGYIGEEEQAVSSKVESAKNSVSNNVKNRAAAEEQAISDKVADKANSISGGAGDVVKKGASDAFNNAMSGFTGLMSKF